jgi:glyceraldehyde-3-phosphate dehydrogenase (NADP+)
MAVHAACTPEEVNKCVDQAKVAQRQWAKVPLWKRAEYLHNFAKLLRDNKDPIANCLMKDVGKCLKDAVVEVSFEFSDTRIILMRYSCNTRLIPA